MRRITLSKLKAYFSLEEIRRRTQKRIRRLLRTYHSKQLNNKDFTIISNNCWGGIVYEYYDVIKQSPTVGLFFMAKDYVKFCANLKYYTTNLELVFINPYQSKYYEQLKDLNAFGSYPIGVLDDIEIMFLHYHTKEEAKEKWERRCERINWAKLILKFNDQNGCTEDDARAFLSLPFKNKLFFTIHEDWKLDSCSNFYIIEQHTKDGSITASHEPYGNNRYFNLTSMINDL